MNTLGILGPGVLGCSTAQWAAECGLEVCLIGRDPAHAAGACREVERRWDAAVAKGRMPDADARAARARLSAHGFGRAPLQDLDALLEALPEDPDAKASALAAVAALAPRNLLILTGTSSLPVGRLAKQAGLQGRLLGFHLFVPVSRMHVVELASPADAPTCLLAQAEALAGRLGKRVVRVQDQPGFAAARMALVQGLEAMRLLEAGVASAEGLYLLMTQGYGHPVGPLELSDRVGLDLRLRIAEGLHAATGEARFRPPDLLQEKVARGETGTRAGQGFFRWDDQGRRL